MFLNNRPTAIPAMNNKITISDVKKLTNDMFKLVTPPGCKIIHVMPQDYIVDNEDVRRVYLGEGFSL